MWRHNIAILILALLLNVSLPQHAFAKDGESGSNSGSGSSNSGSGNSGSGNDDDDDDDDDDGGSNNSSGSSGHGDHDNAKSAFERNAILPINVIIRVALQKVPGRVIAVSLRKKSGDYVYRIRILDRGGRKHDVSINAQTKRVLRVR